MRPCTLEAPSCSPHSPGYWPSSKAPHGLHGAARWLLNKAPGLVLGTAQRHQLKRGRSLLPAGPIVSSRRYALSGAAAAADGPGDERSSDNLERSVLAEPGREALPGPSSINGQQQLPVEQYEPEEGAPVVPWGWGKVAQVMVLWLLAYILIGQVAMPMVLQLLGVDRDELSIRGHAILHLCLDLCQLGVTVLILWRCLREHKPLQRGLFPVRLKGRWPLVVLLCCAVFPVVDWIAHQSVNWFPEVEPWSHPMEYSLSLGDWVTNVAYFSVLSICAPIWEEAIFRGFLLTSLTRFLPVPHAVVLSSLVFAMCHFRTQTFLPLLVLGIVFSAVFLRCNNLLPPVVLHSLWNIFVLMNLLFKWQWF